MSNEEIAFKQLCDQYKPIRITYNNHNDMVLLFDNGVEVSVFASGGCDPELEFNFYLVGEKRGIIIPNP